MNQSGTHSNELTAGYGAGTIGWQTGIVSAKQ